MEGGDAEVEQDRVDPLELGQDAVRQHLAGPQPALGAQVVVDEGEGLLAGGGLEHLEGFRGDLGADAVAADDGEGGGLCFSHGLEASGAPTARAAGLSRGPA